MARGFNGAGSSSNNRRRLLSHNSQGNGAAQLRETFAVGGTKDFFYDELHYADYIEYHVPQESPTLGNNRRR